MSFWRNIASIAARRLDLADCTDCPAGLPGEDPAFSTVMRERKELGLAAAG